MIPSFIIRLFLATTLYISEGGESNAIAMQFVKFCGEKIFLEEYLVPMYHLVICGGRRYIDYSESFSAYMRQYLSISDSSLSSVCQLVVYGILFTYFWIPKYRARKRNVIV